jgi:hypothetical protein
LRKRETEPPCDDGSALVRRRLARGEEDCREDEVGWRGARRRAHLLGLASDAPPGTRGGREQRRSVSVDEMIDRSELVFEGRVIGRRFVDDGDATICAPASASRCSRGEGPEVASPLELCFAGGSSKRGVVRAIAGLEHPAPGERGVYFVESLAALRISPLYGWDQGRFVVAGRATSERPPQGSSRLEASGPAGDGISNGVARGARVAEPGVAAARGPWT